jgi:hypothetical protein
MEIFFALIVLLILIAVPIFLIYSAIKAHKNVQKMNIFSFWHISGINFVDKDTMLNLEINENSILIYQKKDNILEKIDIRNIDNAVVMEELEQTQKNKSVVGRAVVGGLLLGPVGAVVGGMSGVGNKINSKTNYYLQITASGKEIILKPFLNGENMANIAKNKIIEAKKQYNL